MGFDKRSFWYGLLSVVLVAILFWNASDANATQPIKPVIKPSECPRGQWVRVCDEDGKCQWVLVCND